MQTESLRGGCSVIARSGEGGLLRPSLRGRPEGTTEAISTLTGSQQAAQSPSTQRLLRHFVPRNDEGFTLLELLIVISIIAILAATIVPNFIGFDTEARLSASTTNLNTLRTRVALFRAKEGEYPASLGDLMNKNYEDMGVQQPYLEKLPPEMISSKGGSSIFEDVGNIDELSGKGGWAYVRDRAKVVVNITTPLDNKWGKSKGQVPAEW